MADTYPMTAPPEEPTSYAMTGVDTEPPLKGNSLTQRAIKYHFVLGDQSPGLDEIEANLASGQEQQYQDILVNREMASRATAGQQLVLDNVVAGTNADPQLIAQMADPGSPPDKSIVMEEQWVKKATDAVLSAKDGSAVLKALDIDPMGAGDKLGAFEEIQLKKVIANRIKDQIDTQVANTGWAPWAGYQALQLIQFPSFANIITNRPGAAKSSAWTSAGALEQKAAYINSLPPKEMYDTLQTEVYSLARTNPLDAQKLANAVISYTTGDYALDVVNDLSMIPVGTILKGGKAAVSAAKTAVKVGETAGPKVAAGVAEEAGKAAGGAAKAGEALSNVKAPPRDGSTAHQAVDTFNESVTQRDVLGPGSSEPHKAMNNAGEIYKTANGDSHIIGLDDLHAEILLKDGSTEPVKIGGQTIWDKDGNIIDPSAVAAFKNSSGSKWIVVRQKGQPATVLPGMKAPLKDPVTAEMEAITRAVSSPAIDVDTALAGSGKVKAASEYAIRQQIAETMMPNAPGAVQRQFANMLKKLPSLTKVAVKVNPGDNFHAARWVAEDPLVERFLNASQSVMNMGRVSRLPEEALNKAFEAAEKVLREDYTSLNDRILDIQRVMPGESPLNIGMLKINFGKSGMVPFDTVEAAEQAIRTYGLPRELTVIKNNGDKFHVETYATVGEDNVIDKVLTPDNMAPSTSMWTKARGWLGSKMQTSTFQNAQRAATVRGESGMGAAMRDMYRPLDLLSKREKKALDKIMTQNQLEERIPGDPSTRGMFYKNEAELTNAYMRHNNRLPTQAETDAYFAFVRANDMDWIVRSMQELRKKAVIGVQNVKVGRMISEGKMGYNTFEGKLLKPEDFPKNSFEANVLVINDKGVVSMEKLADVQKRADELLGVGKPYKLIQPFKKIDEKLFKLSGSTDPVDFVIAADVEQTPLKLNNQVNYRPGFHNDYKADWFVKVPRVKGNRYAGDTTVLAARTQAQAKRFGEHFQKARELFKEGKTAELQDYLNKNLPMDFEEFKRIIDDHLEGDVTTPFAVVRRGTRMNSPNGMDNLFVTGESFSKVFPNVDHTADELYNLSSNFGDPFVAKRDPLLYEMRGGTEDAPAYRLNAELYSPMLTQTRAAGKLIRSELYNDYQLSSAAQYIETFGDNLFYNGKQISREELRKNPLFYVAHGEVKGDLRTVDQAAQLKLAIQSLMGQPSEFALRLDIGKQRLMSSIYERFGEKYLEYIPEKMIPMIADPVSHLRAMAFHMKLGLFNVQQFFVQGAAVTNVALISPINGMASLPASLAMRMVSLTESPAILERMAEHVGKMPSWTKEKFLDSYNAMKRANYNVVSSEMAWRNDAGDPTLFRSKAGRIFLDKGPMFFEAGERAVRATAWNTAYLDFISKNPSKLGKISEYDLGWIRNRADNLAGNMTRDANAFWQNASTTTLFTQFWSYNVRLAELVLGKELTKGEKIRLVSGNALMWGFPPGAGVAYIAGTGDTNYNPFTEDLKAYASKNGIDLDDSVYELIYNGITSKVFEGATSEQLDFGSRYGPSLPPVVDNLQRSIRDEGTTWGIMRELAVAATGAGGSVLNDTMKESSNIYSSISDLVTGEGAGGEFIMTDVANALQEISSVSTGFKLWAAANMSRRRAQSGVLMSDGEDPGMDAVKAILGVESESMTKAFNLAENYFVETKDKEKVKKYLQRHVGELVDALTAKDFDKASQIQRKLKILAEAAGFTPSETFSIVWPDDHLGKRLDKAIWEEMIRRHQGEERNNLQNEYNKRFGN